MLIDWFTVGAQTLNFLILVWLMKRFLYKPVIDAIDAREKRIASELADAAKKQTQADQQRDAFKQKNADFDQQRATLESKASEAMEVERQRLLTEARAAADAMRVKRHEALDTELQTLQQDIAQRSQDEVLAIARKVLTDLAGTTLEQRMVEVFADRLRTLDVDAKANLTQALHGSPCTVQVRSAFDLIPAQQAAIAQALEQTLGAKIPLQFATTPQLISGIELSANGWKISWNIADYLASLEQHVGEFQPTHQPAPDEGRASKTP